MSKPTYQKIEEAKALLKQNGYQIDNLWCINDVKLKFNCTDEQAQNVLYKALTIEATMEQIWYAIDIIAEQEGFISK